MKLSSRNTVLSPPRKPDVPSAIDTKGRIDGRLRVSNWYPAKRNFNRFDWTESVPLDAKKKTSDSDACNSATTTSVFLFCFLGRPWKLEESY